MSRYRRGGSVLTADTHAFRGVLGAKVIICKPADPEVKGLLQRMHGYLETSFSPVVHRPGRLQDPARRVLREREPAVATGTGLRPRRRITVDKAAMLSLPPVGPATGWWTSRRLPRDYYVRLNSNDCSVDPAVIGQRSRWSPT